MVGLYYRYAKNAATLNECGIDAYFPILRIVRSLDDAMTPENAEENLSGTVEQVFRVIRTFVSSS